MATIEAPRSWRSPAPSEGVGTDTNWPILSAGLFVDAEGPAEQPTTNLSFQFVLGLSVEPDSARVRRAVGRAVDEFGPAFDRLGQG